MTSRDQVLQNIRRGQERAALNNDRREQLEARLREHPRGPVPARGQRERSALVALFESQARAAAATVIRVESLDDVPAAVSEFLVRENLPADLVLAPDPRLDEIPWHKRPMLSLTRGRTHGEHVVSVTGAFAGIAETGTLMLLSGPDSPTTLNLLPETHIVVIRREEIVGPMEDAWDRVRAKLGGDMPRTVNFITGPSRSADIGQQLQMGAHGPRRLHIVLVDGKD